MSSDKEKEFAFEVDAANRYPYSWILMRVTAYDPMTRNPVYGEIIAQNRSRKKISDAHIREYDAGRGATEEFPFYTFHAFHLKTIRDSKEDEMMQKRSQRLGLLQ